MSKAPKSPSTDHSAVALPAGSFDHAALGSALDVAAQAKPDARDAAVAEALVAGSATELGATEQHRTEGYEFRNVETEIAPGVIVTERIQVPVGDLATAGVTEPDASEPAQPLTTEKFD
jgi:hypothetical protein